MEFSTWADFEAETALERDMLARCLPLARTEGPYDLTATIDLATDSVAMAVQVRDTLGATPASCIDLLAIRPLLVGAAWKVLDLLLEAALEAARQRPRSGRGWRIQEKVDHAKATCPAPEAIPMAAWLALLSSYVATEELRHSLVHRSVFTDPAGELIGSDTTGQRLQPMSTDEQHALGRAVLRAAQLVTAQVIDPRVQADLTRQLGLLVSWHGVSLPEVSSADCLPQITVWVDPDPAAPCQYLLDVPALRARQPFKAVTEADLVLALRDQPGKELRGRLENAPNELVKIDPADPPGWLNWS